MMTPGQFYHKVDEIVQLDDGVYAEIGLEIKLEYRTLYDAHQKLLEAARVVVKEGDAGEGEFSNDKFIESLKALARLVQE